MIRQWNRTGSWMITSEYPVMTRRKQRNRASRDRGKKEEREKGNDGTDGEKTE